MSGAPRWSIRERLAAWRDEIDAYYYGIRGWGLVLVLGGAVGVGWSLDLEAIRYLGALASAGIRTNGTLSVTFLELTTGRLVMDGTLSLPLASSAIALGLLMFSRLPLGRVLAALCAVGALAAVSVVAFRPDEKLLSGFLLFWIATGAIALGACLCNVSPRVLARRGRTDDSFPA